MIGNASIAFLTLILTLQFFKLQLQLWHYEATNREQLRENKMAIGDIYSAEPRGKAVEKKL